MGAGDHMEVGYDQAAVVPHEPGPGAAWNLLHVETEVAASQGGVGDEHHRGAGFAEYLRAVLFIVGGEAEIVHCPRGVAASQCRQQQQDRQALPGNLTHHIPHAGLQAAIAQGLLEGPYPRGIGAQVADPHP